MINLILKAKHWQIFLVTTIFPLLLQFILMGFFMSRMFGSIMTHEEPDPEVLIYTFGQFRYLGLAMVLLYAGTYLWQWAVAIGLQARLPVELKKNTSWFTFAIIVPFILMLVISLISWSLFDLILANPEQSFEHIPWFFSMFAIVPFSLVAMGYCFYFLAKTIKTMELQREVELSEFILEIVLIWFFIVGVWLLQPKINEMAKES